MCIRDRVVSKEEEMILIALNKPAGIVCTAEKREKNNVIDYLNYPKSIYPIGRLDKDSAGLLLPVSYTHLDVYKRQVLFHPHQAQQQRLLRSQSSQIMRRVSSIQSQTLR